MGQRLENSPVWLKAFPLGGFQILPCLAIEAQGLAGQSAVVQHHRKTVVEGYKTAAAFADLCVERGIEAPILREVHAILYKGKAPAAVIAALMTRGLKSE